MNTEQIDTFYELQKRIAHKKAEIKAMKERHDRELKPLEGELHAIKKELAPFLLEKLGLKMGDRYRCRFDYNGATGGMIYSIIDAWDDDFIYLKDERGGMIGVYGLEMLHKHWEKV